MVVHRDVVLALEKAEIVVGTIPSAFGCKFSFPRTGTINPFPSNPIRSFAPLKRGFERTPAFSPSRGGTDIVDIGSETLFNGATAVVATVAVLFFILNAKAGYSPVSKVALVSRLPRRRVRHQQRTSDYQLTLLGYGVVVMAVVALFFDVVNDFDAGDEVMVVGLVAVSAPLFALRTRLGEDDRFVSVARIGHPSDVPFDCRMHVDVPQSRSMKIMD